MPDHADTPPSTDLERRGDLSMVVPEGTPIEHVVHTEEADLDGDGKVDAVTETEILGLDTNGDGIVDTIVRAQTTVVDVDGDAVTDMARRTETVLVDLDGDGTPDIGREVEILAFDSQGTGDFDQVQVSEREGFVENGEIVSPDDALGLEGGTT
jgi:hypothetical protein